MDRFQYEAFGRKIALFYHPLFRKTIEMWAGSFSSTSKNMNILSFIEVNVRIQKAMIYPTEIHNSMSSALADWYKELEEITQRERKPLSAPKTTTLKLSLPDVAAMYPTLISQPASTQEQYNNFFKQNRNHIAMKYSGTLLSLVGFSKFLFDLCVSWCETLDIELFCYFLNGLFLHITSGDTLKNSTLRKYEDIDLFLDSFYNFFKTQKTHHQRYIRGNLNTLQPWCEWNYFRLKEIKGRLIENFLQIFPESDKQRILDIQEIFDLAQAEIPADLTKFNLVTLAQFHSNAKPVENEKETSVERPKSNQNKDSKKSGASKISKKGGHGDPNAGVVKTIDSVNFFLADGVQQFPPMIEVLYDGLFPIWEKELSECNSSIDLRQSNFGIGGFTDDLPKFDVQPRSHSSSSTEENSNKDEASSKELSKQSEASDKKIGIEDQGGAGPPLPTKLTNSSLLSSVKNPVDSLDFSIPKSTVKPHSLPSVQGNDLMHPVSKTPSEFPKSLTHKLPMKPPVDPKLGNTAIMKRKQNLLPINNFVSGMNSLSHDEKSNAERNSVTHDESKGSKVQMPKILPKSAHHLSSTGSNSRHKDTIRETPKDEAKEGGKDENENVILPKKTSKKRLSQSLRPKTENLSERLEEHPAPSNHATKDPITRMNPDLEKNLERLRQTYNLGIKREGIKLPKTIRDVNKNEGIESAALKTEKQEHAEMVSKISDRFLMNVRKFDMQQEMNEKKPPKKLTEIKQTTTLPRTFGIKKP